MKKMLFLSLIFAVLFQSMNINSAQIHKKNDTSLQIIPKNESLKVVQNLVEQNIKAGIKPSEIVVAFDFDQTLTAKKGISLGLRGDNETRQMLDYLNKNNISWFIVTASTSTDSPAISFTKSLKLDFPKHLTNDCQKGGSVFEKKYGPIKIDGEELTFKICNNIITCYSNPYRKEMSLEAAIKHYKLPYPKLVIFVDDNPGNVITLFNYFENGLGKNKGVKFIGLVYEPLVKAEEGYEANIKEIQSIISMKSKEKAQK